MSATPTNAEIAAILDRLNNYTGDNVWQDVISMVDGYDDEATDRIDRGRSDRFVAAGVEYAFNERAGTWEAWS